MTAPSTFYLTREIKRKDLGRLPWVPADVGVWRLENGNLWLVYVLGSCLLGRQKLVCELGVRNRLVMRALVPRRRVGKFRELQLLMRDCITPFYANAGTPQRSWSFGDESHDERDWLGCRPGPAFPSEFRDG